MFPSPVNVRAKSRKFPCYFFILCIYYNESIISDECALFASNSIKPLNQLRSDKYELKLQKKVRNLWPLADFEEAYLESKRHKVKMSEKEGNRSLNIEVPRDRSVNINSGKIWCRNLIDRLQKVPKFEIAQWNMEFWKDQTSEPEI